MNKDNTPTFNVNRNVVNFKDFSDNIENEKEELKKIKRSTIPNSEHQQHPGNKKYKYNKVSHKMDDMSPSEIDDKIDAIENESTINEFFGGSLNDLMNPRVDELIEYLEKYKEKINRSNSIIIREDTYKIDDMYNYIIHNIDLDTISSSRRQGRKIRGEGENIVQKIKRSVKNFK